VTRVPCGPLRSASFGAITAVCTNFLRWFPISNLDDCQGLVELTLALLARIYRHHSGRRIKLTVQLPRGE
jgi:hypothetical protein